MLRLFVNDVVLDEDTVAADFEEPTDPRYRPAPIAPRAWRIEGCMASVEAHVTKHPGIAAQGWFLTSATTPPRLISACAIAGIPASGDLVVTALATLDFAPTGDIADE